MALLLILRSVDFVSRPLRAYDAYGLVTEARSVSYSIIGTRNVSLKQQDTCAS